VAQGSEIERVIDQVMQRSRTIAVIGAHVREHKPAFYVPEYMSARGYRMLPVNPAFVGRELWGEDVVARVTDLDEAIDGVDVFRRGAAVSEHLEEILSLRPLPRWVWLQLGIRHDRVAEALRREGITVIQDRCLLSEHGEWVARGGLRN